MNILRSPHRVSSMSELDPEALRQAMPGIEGVTFDVHQTVTDQRGNPPPTEHLIALKGLVAGGLRVGLLSTAASAERSVAVVGLAGELAEELGCSVPVVTSYITGRAKPHPVAFAAIAAEMACAPRALCHVGNEVWRDIWGANNAGFGGAVLVDHFGPPQTPRNRWCVRPADAALRYVLGWRH